MLKKVWIVLVSFRFHEVDLLCLSLTSQVHCFPLIIIIIIILLLPQRQSKKRRRSPKSNKNSSGHLTPAQSFDWESTESRPLVPSRRKEAGEDYWIDEKDLLKFEAEQQAMKDRKEALMLSAEQRRRDGVVSKEKLMTEVKAPYKQNWIGYFSVGIAILSTIIIKFPELLDQPTIRIPDL